MTICSKHFRPFLVVLIVAFVLTGCGGTKVYDTTKTIVYNGSIYQVTDVKQISTTIDGITPDKQTINLKNKDKGQVSDLIEQHDPLFVRMAFQLDDQELVYSATEVDSYRDYNRMLSRFEDAGDDIAKLMAEKKTEQLKLR
jgi:PBP1b-binding outer membrane lipoprotein LpoB